MLTRHSISHNQLIYYHLCFHYQVEFSWTKNGRFIDTTTGHVNFESRDNGEAMHWMENIIAAIVIIIMNISIIIRKHYNLQRRSSRRGSLSVRCLKLGGSRFLKGQQGKTMIESFDYENDYGEKESLEDPGFKKIILEIPIFVSSSFFVRCGKDVW